MCWKQLILFLTGSSKMFSREFKLYKNVTLGEPRYRFQLCIVMLGCYILKVHRSTCSALYTTKMMTINLKWIYIKTLISDFQISFLSRYSSFATNPCKPLKSTLFCQTAVHLTQLNPSDAYSVFTSLSLWIHIFYYFWQKKTNIFETLNLIYHFFFFFKFCVYVLSFLSCGCVIWQLCKHVLWEISRVRAGG